MAFFAKTSKERPITEADSPKCGSCGLSSVCNTSFIPIQGKGKKKVLFIIGAPDFVADEKGLYLTGEKLHVLRSYALSAGLDLEEDCWIAGALACGNPDPDHEKGKDNLKKLALRVEDCRPYLINSIRKLKPDVIVPMGLRAMKSVLSVAFKKAVGEANIWHGWQIPSYVFNAWICPTYSPKEVVNAVNHFKNGDVYSLFFRDHIQTAASMVGTPLPSFNLNEAENRIQYIQDVRKLDKLLRPAFNSDKPFTFDYEANCLNAYWGGAKLRTCATYHDGVCLAFPMVGEAKKYLKRVLQSSTPKRGANTKFEDHWSRVHVGTAVKNWDWDAMLSAHHLDCREGITSVKFQAFVRLGLMPWGEDISPFFVSQDGSKYNRIFDLDLEKLLWYNGIDAIAEAAICEHQKKEQENERFEFNFGNA